MKSEKMGIEELLSDESFINYCKKSSTEDIAWWEAYIRDNPDRQMLVKEAKTAFSEVFNALAQADLDEQENILRNRIDKVESTPIVKMQGFEVKKSRNIFKLIKISIAAAVVLVAVFFTVKYNNSIKKESFKTFAAANGERKDFQLPDGSVITLNGGSKIQITECFGISCRDIYLEGEAFFDVKKNTELPFIVHTPAMDVKALGTAFNVKAYPGEKITETSLLRGLVEVTLKENNNRKMLLHPNQKVHWEQTNLKTGSSNSTIVKAVDHSNSTDSLLKKLVVRDDGDIKEIAWKENKLIFEDDSFEDIAVLLERWYGVKISFMDDEIRKYRFTGPFEKEELSTVLNFLKESRDFNYEIVPGETLKINLSK